MTENEAVDAAVEAAKPWTNIQKHACQDAARHAFRAAVRECEGMLRDIPCAYFRLKDRFPAAFKEDTDD